MTAPLPLTFKSLTIDRAERWLDPTQPLRGELTVVQAEGGTAEIKVRLSEEAARRVVELCADGFVEAMQQIATMTIASIQRPPIPAIQHVAQEPEVVERAPRRPLGDVDDSPF